MSFLFGDIPYKFVGQNPKEGRTSRVQVGFRVSSTCEETPLQISTSGFGTGLLKRSNERGKPLSFESGP